MRARFEWAANELQRRSLRYERALDSLNAQAIDLHRKSAHDFAPYSVLQASIDDVKPILSQCIHSPPQEAVRQRATY